MSFNVCFAHQNERSAGLASGTIEYAEPKNADLGAVIEKSHKIQVHVGRASSRMEVYGFVQDKREHKPKLKPDPSVETRWNSTIDETRRTNQIMGDISETISILHGPNGADEDLSNDADRFVYTTEDKMILRQYEGAAAPAKSFSKFTQDRRESWSYVLFEARLAINTSREEYFAIVQGMHH